MSAGPSRATAAGRKVAIGAAGAATNRGASGSRCSCSDGTVAGYCSASPRLGNMQRIIGTEVEYGISSPSDPTANPILTSTQAVVAEPAPPRIPRPQRPPRGYGGGAPPRGSRGVSPRPAAGPPPGGGGE